MIWGYIHPNKFDKFLSEDFVASNLHGFTVFAFMQNHYRSDLEGQYSLKAWLRMCDIYNVKRSEAFLGHLLKRRLLIPMTYEETRDQLRAASNTVDVFCGCLPKNNQFTETSFIFRHGVAFLDEYCDKFEEKAEDDKLYFAAYSSFLGHTFQELCFQLSKFCLEPFPW